MCVFYPRLKTELENKRVDSHKFLWFSWGGVGGGTGVFSRVWELGRITEGRMTYKIPEVETL